MQKCLKVYQHSGIKFTTVNWTCIVFGVTCWLVICFNLLVLRFLLLQSWCLLVTSPCTEVCSSWRAQWCGWYLCICIPGRGHGAVSRHYPCVGCGCSGAVSTAFLLGRRLLPRETLCRLCPLRSIQENNRKYIFPFLPSPLLTLGACGLSNDC